VEHFLLLTALAKNGMGESSVDFKNMTIADAAAAFAAGKVDAAAVWQPWIAQLERENKAKVLFSSKEMPGLVPDQLVFQESVVNDRADDIQKIVASWFDVVEFIKAHEDEAVGIMAKVVAQKPEDYKAFLPGTRLFDLDANLEAFQSGNSDRFLTFSGKKIAAFLQAKEVIKSIPDFAGSLEPKFVKALKK
jgi:NitT/TauT family transport system substrate-binding protein